MAFQYLTNIPLERAKRDYEDILISEGFRGEAEEISAVSSLGRTTASPVYAKICSPHYPASAMDGIAIRAEDTFGATETAPVPDFVQSLLQKLKGHTEHTMEGEEERND